MLFCSHAVEKTLETGPDLPMSLDSKVSGFDRPHVSKKLSDSKVSILESGFKSFDSGERIQNFPDSQVGFTGCVWTKGVHSSFFFIRTSNFLFEAECS